MLALKRRSKKDKMPPQPVSTIIAQSENIPLHFSYPAQLVSDYDAFIKPQVSGVIIENFRSWSKSKKGR